MTNDNPITHHIQYAVAEVSKLPWRGNQEKAFKSIWTSLTEEDRKALDGRMAALLAEKKIAGYIVTAYSDEDGCFPEEMNEELDDLEA